MDETTEPTPSAPAHPAGPAAAQTPAPGRAPDQPPTVGPAAGAAGQPPGAGRVADQPASGPAPSVERPTVGLAGEQPPPRYDRWSAKLERPHEGRVLGGVCAGMGEAWRVDPLALRIAFLAATVLLFPAGAVLYLACWILMPAADDE